MQFQASDLTWERVARFWSRVNIGQADDCWNWVGTACKDGYGIFTIRGKHVVATHIALTLAGWHRPEGTDNLALHSDKCTTRCVNPRHLRWGTCKENSADMVRLGHARAHRGEAHHLTRLKNEDIVFIRTSLMRGSELASMFGVSRPTITLIRQRKVWKHIP